MFGVCVLFIYTILISIICVSQEEPSLIASNEQIDTFYKCVVFKYKRYYGQQFFEFSELFCAIQVAAVST